ncbi:hypothetical protein CBOM_00045 [Ceraceosorus bombacis]|uniref:Uncharacterized protein n=1 Tax=Ceraceosorus bombacis TaxID=401625 RepID=A0A0P1BAD7_9BASI|nr:hypothetical protein CBOM_00045 [Ceraceosorus bombacis]
MPQQQASSHCSLSSKETITLIPHLLGFVEAVSTTDPISMKLANFLVVLSALNLALLSGGVQAEQLWKTTSIPDGFGYTSQQNAWTTSCKKKAGNNANLSYRFSSAENVSYAYCGSIFHTDYGQAVVNELQTSHPGWTFAIV